MTNRHDSHRFRVDGVHRQRWAQDCQSPEVTGKPVTRYDQIELPIHIGEIAVAIDEDWDMRGYDIHFCFSTPGVSLCRAFRWQPEREGTTCQ